MAYEVILPKLGQTVEEGRIVEWLKAEGDQVERGDVLFTVETDKAVLDVEATRKGFLRKILFEAGELLNVLTVVAYITRTADEPLDEVSSGAAPVTAAEAVTQQTLRQLLRSSPFRMHRQPQAVVFLSLPAPGNWQRIRALPCPWWQAAVPRDASLRKMSWLIWRQRPKRRRLPSVSRSS